MESVEFWAIAGLLSFNAGLHLKSIMSLQQISFHLKEIRKDIDDIKRD